MFIVFTVLKVLAGINMDDDKFVLPEHAGYTYYFKILNEIRITNITIVKTQYYYVV